MKHLGRISFLMVPFLCVFLALQAGQSPIKKADPRTILQKSLRMMMLIDDSESFSGVAGPVAKRLAVGLSQKTSPIIATHSLVKTLLKRMYEVERSNNPENKEFKDIGLNLAEWDVYHAPENAYYLFIPKTMHFLTEPVTFSNGELPPLRAAPLQVDKKDLIKLEGDAHTSGTSLMEYVGRQGRISDKGSPSQYFFGYFDVVSQLKDNGKLKELAGEYVEKDSTKFDQGIFTSGQKWHEIVDSYFSLMPSWNIILTGHGSLTERNIAGLDTESFQSLLKDFSRVRCALMVIESCFSGGENRKALVVVDKSRTGGAAFPKVTYPILLLSTTDAPVVDILNDGKNLTHFFEALENTEDPYWLGNAARYALEKKGLLDFRNVAQLYLPNVGSFSITIPHENLGENGIKVPFKGVLVLGEVLNKKFALEESVVRARLKKLQQLSTLTTTEEKNKNELQQSLKNGNEKNVAIDLLGVQLVAIGTQRVTVPLVIKGTGLYPQFLPMKYNVSGYIIDSISLEGENKAQGIFAFLRESFLLPNARETDVRFMIGKLTGINDFSRLEVSAESSVEFETLKKSAAQLSAIITLTDVVVSSYLKEEIVGMGWNKREQTSLLINAHFKCAGTYWSLSLRKALGDQLVHTVGVDSALGFVYNAQWTLKRVGVAPWNVKDLDDDELLYSISRPDAFSTITPYDSAAQDIESDVLQEVFLPAGITQYQQGASGKSKGRRRSSGSTPSPLPIMSNEASARASVDFQKSPLPAIEEQGNHSAHDLVVIEKPFTQDEKKASSSEFFSTRVNVAPGVIHALELTIQTGDIEKVAKLLKDVDVNLKVFGRYSLIGSVLYWLKDQKLAQNLLDRGAKPDMYAISNLFPLLSSGLKKVSSEFAQNLISKLENGKELPFDEKRHYLTSALREAIPVEVFETLVKAFGFNIMVDGGSLLYDAIYYQRFDSNDYVAYLLRHRAPVDYVAETGSVLYLALKQVIPDSLSIWDVLLNRGATITKEEYKKLEPDSLDSTREVTSYQKIMNAWILKNKDKIVR